MDVEGVCGIREMMYDMRYRWEREGGLCGSGTCERVAPLAGADGLVLVQLRPSVRLLGLILVSILG